MTDVILELKDGRVYFFYIHDGKNRVVLISEKRSWVERQYKPPKEYKKFIALLERLARG